MTFRAWGDYPAIPVLGISLMDWARAASPLILSIVLLRLLRLQMIQRVTARLRGSVGALMTELVRSTTAVFILSLGLYAGARELPLSSPLERGIQSTALVIFWFQIGRWASSWLQYSLHRELIRRGAQDSAFVSAFNVLSFVAQAIVWLVALAIALANAGVNVVALLTGLGVGGAAVALATRGVLANLFARASISLDGTFLVGDMLKTDTIHGRVERIGNRTTQIRSIDGELIVVANADLLASRLRNFGDIQQRREVLILQLAGNSSTAQTREALQILARSIQEQSAVRLDRCHFSHISGNVLQLEAVYYVGEGACALADVREAIDARVYADLAAAHIQLAYPRGRFRIMRA